MRMRVAVFSTFTALVFLLLPSVALADMGVTPSKVELFIAPGGSYTAHLTVVNSGDTPMRIDAAPYDFARDRSGVVYAVDERDAATFHACGKWLGISFGDDPVLAPGENRVVSVVITVPQDVEYGSYYTYVQIMGTPTEVEEGVTPAVLQMNALLLAIVCPPDAEGQYLSDVDELVREAILEDMKVAETNFGDVVPVSATVANKGNVHLDMQGYVDILQGATLIARIPVSECTLLPESTLDIVRNWEDTPPIGRFTARFWADAGLGQPFIGERVFWVISPWLLVSTVGLLAGIAALIAHMRINRPFIVEREEAE